MGLRVVTLERAVVEVAHRFRRPRVVSSGNFATPWPVVQALDEALDEWTLHLLNAQPGVPVREGLRLETCFVGPGMRGAPTLSYVPCRLSMVPLLLKERLTPDVVVVHATPPKNGQISLGVEVNILPAAIEAARAAGGLVIAVLNDQMPFTYGDAVLDIHDVDLAVEISAPLGSPTSVAAPDDDSRAIGERVAARVGDGATLQAGIGAIPNAALDGLTSRHGLKVWSEMFSDGVLALDRSGALDPEHPLVSSFVFGSPELYAWVDENPRVRMARTEKVNDPALIARQHAMVSINTALQVDLWDQANASWVRSRIHSGLGGQSDFVVGASHSPGGQALLALRSWHPKADRSSIVTALREPATSFLHTAVVTEQGVAEIWGADQDRLATTLIKQAASPRARDELWEGARREGLVRG